MRFVTTIVAVLTLLALAWPSALHAQSSIDPTELEIILWREIEYDKSAGGYEAYLKEFPHGLFRELALNRLSAFKPGTPTLGFDDVTPLSPRTMGTETYGRLELAFWDAIRDSTDVKDYSVYLVKFPDGAFRALARARISALLP